MKHLRWILKISYKDHKTNDFEVQSINKLGPEEPILNIMKSRKFQSHENTTAQLKKVYRAVWKEEKQEDGQERCGSIPSTIGHTELLEATQDKNQLWRVIDESTIVSVKRWARYRHMQARLLPSQNHFNSSNVVQLVVRKVLHHTTPRTSQLQIFLCNIWSSKESKRGMDGRTDKWRHCETGISHENNW